MSEKDAITSASAVGITIPIYENMAEDLPPLVKTWLEDWADKVNAGEYGNREAAIRLFCYFTHHPDADAEAPILPRLLWVEGRYSRQQYREIAAAGFMLYDEAIRYISELDGVDEEESSGTDKTKKKGGEGNAAGQKTSASTSGASA